MLIQAKKYDEEILPYIINSLKHFYKNNEQEKIECIHKTKLKTNDKGYENLKEDLKNYITKLNEHNITIQPVVRYGDSVIGKTPLLLRNNKSNIIFIESINNIVNSNKYQQMQDSDKEYVELSNIDTWTEKGWTKVQRVIRHRLSKDKKLFNITTNSGNVVVTDDHSLLTNEAKRN